MDDQGVYRDRAVGQSALRTIARWYRVDRRRISFIKFILEAYDNLAVVSTVDAKRAIIRIVTTPGGDSLVNEIMMRFSRDFQVSPIDVESDTGESQYEFRAFRQV